MGYELGNLCLFYLLEIWLVGNWEKRKIHSVQVTLKAHCCFCNAQTHLDFAYTITPKGRVIKWKVMPFGVANAPALIQELMNKNLYILSPDL